MSWEANWVIFDKESMVAYFWPYMQNNCEFIIMLTCGNIMYGSKIQPPPRRNSCKINYANMQYANMQLM